MTTEEQEKPVPFETHETNAKRALDEALRMLKEQQDLKTAGLLAELLSQVQRRAFEVTGSTDPVQTPPRQEALRSLLQGTAQMINPDNDRREAPLRGTQQDANRIARTIQAASTLGSIISDGGVSVQMITRPNQVGNTVKVYLK